MTVKISSKYQVVIPEGVRKLLNLKAGSTVDVVAKGGVAYLVPIKSVQDLQNRFKGRLDQVGLRDKKDRI